MSINELTFGVELECFLPTGLSRNACAQAVTERLAGANVCRVEPYSHMATAYWKVTTDGSLGDYTLGIEIVSPALPPLQGEAGLDQLAKVCEALTDLGCTVNRAAGFHVHVGASNESLRFWKNIARLYQTFEPVIDSFMPASRRASNNPYCRTLTTTPVANIEGALNVGHLASVIQNATRSGEARYHKVNVDAFRRHGTVEFRQHSGTIDARKTRNWVLTCLRMVEAAKGHLNFGTSTSNPVNRARPGSKAYQIGQMLLRPEGATGPEVCQAMGWPRVSMPAQARAAGLEVYSQRTGRVVRYYVRRDQTADANASNMTVTLDGFCALINSTDDEKAYLTARVANLRGNMPWAA